MTKLSIWIRHTRYQNCCEVIENMEFSIILRKNEYLFESTIMKIDVRKIPVTQESMAAYMSGNSVKRRTVCNSTLNYGRIAIMTDSDVD